MDGDCARQGADAVDTVYVRADDPADDDDDDDDDTFGIIIQVTHWSSLACADWQLTVTGNATTTM